MPLSDGYAVLQGDLEEYFRDPPDDYGKWYHVNLRVRANETLYKCAVDVDSKKSDVGVEWRTVPIVQPDIQSVLDLGDGLHALASNSTSGAIDYIRSPMFRLKFGCWFVRMPSPIVRALIWFLNAHINSWEVGNHEQASTTFESILAGATRCLVWGEPFSGGGHGLHNIHQNQGDPAGSPWWVENGIWQDGGTMVQRPDGNWVAFISKFSTQSFETDSLGHPIP